MTIAIVNPLPTALAHYAKEIDAVLQAVGQPSYRLPTPSVESAGRTPPVLRTARTLLSRLSVRAVADDVLVLWPAFGLFDPVTFRGRRAPTWLIVHDAVPLRRQFGMRAWAGSLGRRALSDRLRVVVHSEPARKIMEQRGWPVSLAPHPILPPSESTTTRGDTVRVLGQWKPARSPEPLASLAAERTLDGRREILGRDWPDVPGWRVDARFLSETEMDDRIAESGSVVIPYDRYFQSGVAVRCLERGTPVAGHRHPFLTDLYGADWPGIVVDDEWSLAVERASREAADAVRIRHEAYWARCVEAWRELLGASAEHGSAAGQ